MNRPVRTFDRVAETAERARRGLREDSQIDKVAVCRVPDISEREIDRGIGRRRGPGERIGEGRRR